MVLRSISLSALMAPPKKQYIPLIILSLLALFVFSLYPSSLPSSPSISLSPQTRLVSTQNPPPQKFSFTIKLLAYNRLTSFSRCLTSLSSAHYDGDTVNLHIYIDHFKTTPNSGSNFIDENLNSSRKILEFVDGFEWKFGEKLVHYRTVNVGLQGQWLEAWWPSSDHEFVFVVEDDLEVSNLYYRFLKRLILKYYYDDDNYSPGIYGASLQRPRFVPGKHGNKIQTNSQLFLYQLVGTWGQLLFPKPWKEFRIWYDIQKAKDVKPIIDGMVTTGWYKRLGEKIWTPWFIKFIHERGYFNIYTNFLHERALSTSHRDTGVNYGKTAGPDSHLLDGSSLDVNRFDMKPLADLKWYDFCFREVIPGRVLGSLDDIARLLRSMQKQNPVFLVSMVKTSEAITKNLLCHFERLNMQNYMLVGPKSNFLLDLARRGHPIVDTDQFFKSIKSQKSLRIQKTRIQLIQEIVSATYIIRKFLESGFDSWIVDANMFPGISNPLDSIDPMHEIYASKVSGFLFVRSSSSTRRIWDEISVQQAAEMIDSSAEHVSSVIVKLLEQQGVRLKSIEEAGLFVQLDTLNGDQSSLGDKKMIFWSPKVGLDAIQKKLERLGLWEIDGSSSCKAVVCHQS